MSSNDNGSERISVSREALRAELAELELRLTRYLDTELSVKANKVEVVAVNTALQDKANAVDFADLRHQTKLLDVRAAALEAQQRVNDRITLDYYENMKTLRQIQVRMYLALGGIAVVGITALVNVLKVWFGVAS